MTRFLRSVSFGLAALSLLALPSVTLAASGVNPDQARPKWYPGPPWAPLAPHSHEMNMISNLFWVMLVLSAIIFLFVCVFLVANIVRFTARPGDPDPPQIYGNRTVELTWTLIPFAILLVAFIFTTKYIHDINTPEGGVAADMRAVGLKVDPHAKVPASLDIKAIGHQWWWEFQYPTYGVDTADELHVPAGVPIHFHVTSADVVHSFWTPQLQRQIDANPAIDNAVYVTLTQLGTYDGDCYEYCGGSHAWMKYRVIVQSPTQFNQWVKHQLQPAATPHGLAALGKKVFLQNTCVNCHAITGVAGGAVGPNLTHVGSRWTIGAGAAAMNLPNLEQWILQPTTFKPDVLMPDYPLLTPNQRKALATYIYSLK